jgi:hypothetical protein
MILELIVQSLSCLQNNAKTLTLKTNRVLPLMTVIKYTKLYDPGEYGSISILLTMSRQTDTQTDGQTDT